jgi:hypothetical protein
MRRRPAPWHCLGIHGADSNALKMAFERGSELTESDRIDRQYHPAPRLHSTSRSMCVALTSVHPTSGLHPLVHRVPQQSCASGKKWPFDLHLLKMR